MLALLDELEYQRRAVFVMYELGQVTLAQIAADMELPLSTVAGQLYAAREDFNAALRRRRAANARRFRGADALLLPLSADAILQIARPLARPEASPDAQARVWAHLEQAIRAPYAAPTRRHPTRARRWTCSRSAHSGTWWRGFRWSARGSGKKRRLR